MEPVIVFVGALLSDRLENEKLGKHRGCVADEYMSGRESVRPANASELIGTTNARDFFDQTFLLQRRTLYKMVNVASKHNRDGLLQMSNARVPNR